MNAEDIVSLLVPATFFTMLAIERYRPARSFPPIRYWRWIGVGFFLISGTMSATLPLFLPAEWLAQHRLLDGTRFGLFGGMVVGYLFVSFVGYVYHRSSHAFSWLWRLTHQIHHSPQRVDLYGAALFHPVDMSVYVLFPVLLSTFVLGLDPLASALVGYVSAFISFFQHWNIRTPHWVGYLIQRPEAHCIHHQRGVHAFNYSDLPLWDMLFGTFRNPARWNGDAGFDLPAARRLGAMLRFVDVNRDRYGDKNRGAPTTAALPALSPR